MVTAKVRNKQIDTGKVLHALVQGEHASGNITFQIIGEEELVEDFNSTYFYLLYTRPSDTRPNVLLLTNKQLQDDVISVTFKPTSYFTAQDGTVQIQIMATDTEGLSIDSETGTISGSVIWQTFPGAMFVHASQLTGAETIIEENVLTQYLAGMQDLNTQTEQAATEAQQAAVDAGDSAEAAAGSATAAQNAKTDAVAARDKAQEWATKLDGKVDNIDYSSKHYASAAKASEQKASEWAEKDTPVETGKYSAKHWAEQAHAEFDALDTYVDETLKPALDDHEETKEGELDTYTASKKADLDTYEGTKETELNTYTGTKKSELDTYTGAKKSELDSYVTNTNKPALDSYTNNTLKPALLAYEQTQEGALNTYTGTKKTELDGYVTNTSKPSIDDYIDDVKKPEIDAYIEQQAGQFGDDVTALKGNVAALDKRVSNIEESLDVITEIEYPDATYGTGEVPPNKSKYAEVTKLRGVSRVKNNLFPTRTLSYTSKGLTVTSNNDGTISISGTTNATGVFDLVSDIGSTYNGKSYLIGLGLNIVSGSAPSASTYGFKYGDSMGSGFFYGDAVATAFATVLNSQDFMMNIYATNVAINITLTPVITDLNVYFNTSDLSALGANDSAKLATIQSDYPWLLTPSPYGTSMVKTRYEGFTSVGVNIWDEVWELGSIGADGNNTPTNDQIRSKNYIRVFRSTAYYVKVPSVGLQIFQYDINKNYISRDFYGSDSSFTTSANCAYLRFRTGSTLTTYQNNIQICLNSVSDKTTYHPYSKHTLSLPTPIELGSAGSVADTHDLASGVTTYNTVDIDLGALTESDWQGTSPIFYILTTDSRFSNLVQAPNNTTALNAIVDKGIVPIARQTMYNDSTQNMVACDTGAFYIKLNSLGSTPTKAQVVAFLDGVHLVGGAITPSTSQGTPLLDNLIPTEGGGTIKPVQTNDPEIDSAMTVTYVNKITA